MSVATLQLVQHRRQDSRTRLTNRMTQRDRATVNVDLVWIQTELTRDRHGLNRKGFIQFDQIDIVERPSRLLKKLLNGVNRRHHHQLRLDT